MGNALKLQIGGCHYKGFAIQPVEFIFKNKLNFIQGSIIKYVCRYTEKNGVEDLYKARHYIDMLIEFELDKPEEITELKIKLDPHNKQ